MKTNRLLIIAVIISSILYNCKKDRKSNLEIAKTYYKALISSDQKMMQQLLLDSLYTVETDYDYEQTFSREQYALNWLPWDAAFNPTYEILEINEDNNIVKATISKIDKRIEFLHHQPTIWKEEISFSEDRILKITRTNVVFNASLWEENRNTFLSWVDEYHPELKGFIFDQTPEGAEKYLRAIQLFSNKE